MQVDESISNNLEKFIWKWIVFDPVLLVGIKTIWDNALCYVLIYLFDQQ